MALEDHPTGAASNKNEDVGWIKVDDALTLADESAVHLDIGGHGLCVVRSLGKIHAIRDECTHGQVALSEGDVDNGYVECWMHGSRFDLTTGVPTGPPATEPVTVYPIRVDGNNIEVRLPISDD